MTLRKFIVIPGPCDNFRYVQEPVCERPGNALGGHIRRCQRNVKVKRRAMAPECNLSISLTGEYIGFN